MYLQSNEKENLRIFQTVSISTSKEDTTVFLYSVRVQGTLCYHDSCGNYAGVLRNSLGGKTKKRAKIKIET